jgi:hypothetical protein
VTAWPESHAPELCKFEAGESANERSE